MNINIDLTKIQFKYFEDINVNEMMFYSEDFSHTFSFFEYFNRLLKVIYFRLFMVNSYEKAGDGKTIFLFSNEYNNREDHRKNFYNVFTLSNNYLKVEGIFKKRIYRLKRDWLKLSIMIKWFRQMKKINITVGEKFRIVTKLYIIYSDYLEFESYIKNNNLEFDSFVSLCDTMATDYLYTKKMNDNNKLTCTLQHGFFSEINPNVIKNSHSKLFFCANQYTIELVNKLNHGSVCELAGMISNIGNNISYNKPIVRNNIKSIGVILDGERFINDNIEMIDYFNKYCDKYDIYYKLHPSNNHSYYINRFSQSKFIESKMTVREFSKIVDLCVVHISTCFFEFLSNDIFFALYDSKENFNIYNIDDNYFRINRFSILINCIKPDQIEKYSQNFIKIKKLYIPFSDTKKRYIEIFNKYNMI